MPKLGPFSYDFEPYDDTFTFNLAYCPPGKNSCPTFKKNTASQNSMPPIYSPPVLPSVQKPCPQMVCPAPVLPPVQKPCPQMVCPAPVCPAQACAPPPACPPEKECPSCPSCPKSPVAPCAKCPPCTACPTYPPPKICPPPTICPSVTATKVYLINTTTQVTEEQGLAMAECLNQQIIQFCEEWALQPYTVIYSASVEPPTTTSTMKIYLTNDSTKVIPGADGYHNPPDSNGVSVAYVAVNQILSEGSNNDVLMPKTGGIAISKVVSHELLEMAINPSGNKAYATKFNMNGAIITRTIIAEICDPVSELYYNVSSSNGTGVQVANYVLPSWFIPGSKGPYDHMNNLSAPFQLSVGGYWNLIENGNVNTYDNKGNVIN